MEASGRAGGLAAPKEEPPSASSPVPWLSLSFPSWERDVSSPQEGHGRFSSYPPPQGEVSAPQGFSLGVAGPSPSALGPLEPGAQKWEGREQRGGCRGRGEPPGAQAARCDWRFAKVDRLARAAAGSVGPP